MTEHKSLYDRLPQIWRRLDTERVLERFCGVLDNAWNRAHARVGQLFDLRSIDRIPDRYVSLPAPLVGHTRRADKSHAWNRRRIQHAIPRHSSKGQHELLGDLIRENGGGGFDVVDMASTLWVWNRQGRLNRGDSHVIAADFHHDGAFLLRVLDDLDFEAFLEDFQDTKPSAERWYFDIQARTPDVISEAAWSRAYELEEFDSSVPSGRFNRDLWLTYAGVSRPTVISEPAPRIESSARHFGRFNRDLFLSFEGAPRPTRISEVGAMGYSGGSITTDSVISVDRADFTVNQGAPSSPISADAALIQEGAEIIEEAV